MPDDRDRYFRDALAGRADITDSYLVLGDLPALVGVSVRSEDVFVERLRDFIVTRGGGLSSISTEAARADPKAADFYRNDRLAAVDGTDAVRPVRFATDTIYAVGVMLVRPGAPHAPRATVTRTRAVHLAPDYKAGVGWEQGLREWAAYLAGAREQEHSWVNTFREYAEREVALGWLNEDADRVALLDGPILTQNMLTQREAHDLLQALVETGRAIGFIKNLSANPLLSAVGYALRADEFFLFGDWSTMLAGRFQEGQEHVSDWIEKHAGAVVRVVYKVDRKPFGIECAAEMVPLALDVLQHDNAGPAEHDVPMLLQLADQHVRTAFDGQSSREELIARFSAGDPGRFLSLVGERSVR